ncbi:MAG: ABC transporter permease [Planctomycetes bacterium]|nr:ABC transporter permease [Planctomycetota bacterium]
MRNVLTLVVREMGAYFRSPIGYSVPILFWVLAGLRFYLDLEWTQGDVEAALAQLMGGVHFWLLTFLIVPALTMRLLAEERRSGTLEMLLTAPVEDWEVVAGKFLGAWLFYAFLWVPLPLYLAAVIFLGGSPDLGAVAANFLGVLLVGALFLAVGLFCSSLTSNQIIAALMCAVGLLVVSFLPEVARLFPRILWIQIAGDQLSFFHHFDEFRSGVVDGRPVVYILTLIGLALFLTARSLEARKWR